MLIRYICGTWATDKYLPWFKKEVLRLEEGSEEETAEVLASAQDVS